MNSFITNTLIPSLSRLFTYVVMWARWLIHKIRLINYSSHKTYIYFGAALLGLVLLVVVYRILNPVMVLREGDFHPFETAAEYDEFIDKNPLITQDEPAGRKFDISSVIRQDKKVVYTIELQSRPIKPEMDDAYIKSYLEMLENSQKDALDWIRSQGINPDELGIVWRPNPQERRSRLLGETTKQVPQKNTVPTDTTTPTATPQPTTRPTSPTAPTPLFPH